MKDRRTLGMAAALALLALSGCAHGDAVASDGGHRAACAGTGYAVEQSRESLERQDACVAGLDAASR